MRMRVSVLLPARDAEATLTTALRSVQRQQLDDFECIIVDDGSRDSTATVAETIAQRDPRFRLVRTPRRGLIHALSTGLDLCTGRYIARMDADDVMRRRRLAAQTDLLDRDDALAGVGSHVRLFPRAELRDGMRAYETWLNAVRNPDDVVREAFVECPLAHPTLCLRREVFAAAGYDDPGWPEDYDLILRLLAGGHRLGTTATRLLAWRDGPARLTRSHPRYRHDAIVACKAAHLASWFLRGEDSYVLWGYGETGRELARALATRGARPTHVIEVHPGRIGNRILGVPTIAPEGLDHIPRRPLIASVSGPGPRAEIRAFLTARGWRDGTDFVCAA